MRSRVETALACASVTLLNACAWEEAPPPAAVPTEGSALRVDESAVPASLHGLFAADCSLEGCWLWNWLPGYDSTAMRVKRIGREEFEVQLFRSTDIGPFEPATVRASWSGAGLVLAERPKWLGRTQILYPARFSGEDCLVPDSSLGELESRLPLWKDCARDDDCEQYAFRRAADGLIERYAKAWSFTPVRTTGESATSSPGSDADKK